MVPHGMDRRRGIGITIFVLSIGGFFVYAYLLMLTEWSPIIQQLTMLMIVGGILGVVAWIGYVTATTRASSATITSDDADASTAPPDPTATEPPEALDGDGDDGAAHAGPKGP